MKISDRFFLSRFRVAFLVCGFVVPSVRLSRQCSLVQYFIIIVRSAFCSHTSLCVVHAVGRAADIWMRMAKNSRLHSLHQSPIIKSLLRKGSLAESRENQLSVSETKIAHETVSSLACAVRASESQCRAEWMLGRFTWHFSTPAHSERGSCWGDLFWPGCSAAPNAEIYIYMELWWVSCRGVVRIRAHLYRHKFRPKMPDLDGFIHINLVHLGSLHNTHRTSAVLIWVSGLGLGVQVQVHVRRWAALTTRFSWRMK